LIYYQEKITTSTLQGLKAKVRFRKALEGGLLELLRHAAAEMIQYPWLCKLARIKLQVIIDSFIYYEASGNY